MKHNQLSIVAIVVAAMLWGSIGLFIRYFNQLGVHSAELTFIRAIVTVIVLFIYLLMKDRSLLKVRIKDIPLFIGTGIISFEFFNLCYMNSISVNSLSVAAILLYTAPIWVTVLSIPLFKEKAELRKFVALVLVMVGCVLVSCSGQVQMTKTGLLFGLGSGLGYAMYTLFGRVATKRYHSATITFYTFTFASLGLIPLAETESLKLCFSNLTSGILVITMVIVTTVIPYVFYTAGLKNVAPSVASMVATVEPVTATILGAVFLGEALSGKAVFGIVIVLVAIGMLNQQPKTHCVEAPEAST